MKTTTKIKDFIYDIFHNCKLYRMLRRGNRYKVQMSVRNLPDDIHWFRCNYKIVEYMGKVLEKEIYE